MKYLLLLFLLLAAGAGRAQTTPPTAGSLEAFYDGLDAYQTPRYRPEPGLEVLRLPSNFSNEDLAALHLGERQLVRVDLVYTAFRLDPKFSQRQLNLGRLRNLAARIPGILENESLSWSLVEQTGCNSPAGCQEYFHGFVLYLEKRYLAADTRREADTLVAKLDSRTKKLARAREARKKRGKPIPCAYPQSYYKLRKINRRLRRAFRCPDQLNQTVRFRAEADATGRIRSVSILGDSTLPCRAELARQLQGNFAFANGFKVGRLRFPFAVEGLVRLPLRRHSLGVTGYFLADSLVKKYRVRLRNEDCVARQLRPGEPLDDDPLPNPDAGVVSKVLSRHPEWRKQVVVADVTGSMYPYTLDLLTWLQLSALQEAKTFVFFNDGNDAPDKKKQVGSTGGLYDVTTADFGLIKAKVLEAMLAGGGGDAPENDGEALRRAQELVPDATEIIWLADNHTSPRDVRLLKNTRAQVRIVLCGAHRFVNTRYLSLARRHGFTLHTLEGDLTNLSALLEGQTVTIQGLEYLVTRDGFRLVKKL